MFFIITYFSLRDVLFFISFCAGKLVRRSRTVIIVEFMLVDQTWRHEWGFTPIIKISIKKLLLKILLLYFSHHLKSTRPVSFSNANNDGITLSTKWVLSWFWANMCTDLHKKWNKQSMYLIISKNKCAKLVEVESGFYDQGISLKSSHGKSSSKCTRLSINS